MVDFIMSCHKEYVPIYELPSKNDKVCVKGVSYNRILFSLNVSRFRGMRFWYFGVRLYFGVCIGWLLKGVFIL